jgi:hypothetical protein
MFERYTEKARRVIVNSFYEARQFGNPFIEPEHLLLGLLREDTALASKLSQSELSPEIIRNRIEKESPPGETIPTAVDLPLSPASKAALVAAAKAADRLGHKHIGTEHLVLGIMLQKSTLAAKLLAEAGFNVTDFRQDLCRAEHYPGRVAAVPRRSVQDYVEIHGELFSLVSVREFAEYYSRKFQWEKRAWAPRDALVRCSDNKIFLYFGQPYDAEQYKLVKGAWNEDRCGICWWKLTDLNEPEHDEGYTNGQDWLCTECYERFVRSGSPENPKGG